MKFVVTGAGNDNGEIYDVEVVARKLNGYWCKAGKSVFFACRDDIRVLDITEEERTMPIYWEPGYPGKE